MISSELAVRLRDAGVRWTPASGDRFIVPGELDGELFVISEMTIEAHPLPGGQTIIKFNGTTEWALDSLDAARAVWLPREDQLRDLLGERFARLETVPGGFVVVLDDESRHVDIDAERAYARALLDLRKAD